MFPRLPIPYLQPFSFFVGFFAGILFFFLLGRARPLLKQMRAGMKEKRETVKLRGSANVEESHRKQTLKYAQGQHLAANLFSLDEILQPVHLIAPPPFIEPEGVIRLEDAVSQSVPYLPTWPEMAATYNTATLSLPEALSGGSNIVIIGQAGSGKSVALAHLASMSARKDETLGELAEHVPILVHVADLNLPIKNPNDLLNPISEILSSTAPMFIAGRIPNFIEYAFKSGRALLLLDGLDELHPEGANLATEYVLEILKSYPKTRIVTTGSFEYAGGLIKLGFTPLSMAIWNMSTQADFLEVWADLWDQYVSVEAWVQAGPDPVDSVLLNQWLTQTNNTFTPMEFTLKVWGAFAGDARGPRTVDALETHVYRLTPTDVPQEALHILAMQTTATGQPVFDPRKARSWVKSFEPEEEIEEATEPENQENIQDGEDAAPDDEQNKKSKKRKAKKGKSTKKSKAKIETPPPTSGLISKLSESGLLAIHPNNRMRFIHPALSNYLSGRGIATYGGASFQDQSSWAGKNASFYYAAAYGEIGKQTQQQINSAKKPLQRELLTAARWLREAPPKAVWRGAVFAALADLVQDETTPISLRAQAITAMALSGDPSVNALFRQLMQNSTSPSVIQLAALGAGIARDAKAIPNLSALAYNPTPGVRRATCLALVAIGTEPALEAVASALLTGDEDLRRVAAEALANIPGEGREMLREGTEMEDILVRRSVVYGLGRVHEPWANQLLEKIQVEDEQWVVRTAATEVIDSRKKPNPHIPRRLQPAHATPWIIEFAGKQGMGVSPGQDPTDLLLLALKSEIPEEQLAALAYLRHRPTPGVLSALYNALYGSELELREAAFHVIHEMALSGIKLPDPMEYGLG